ncbi:unnamed protein product [Chrysodeixis includens]|uniref:Uncharacterized protein n=1 Tax=Chrysodeixis includens TaxID=689277 RepID=A0A9N8KWB6_CHRIL|nr:unnamed protein product [Chrysodeixis includens]
MWVSYRASETSPRSLSVAHVRPYIMTRAVRPPRPRHAVTACRSSEDSTCGNQSLVVPPILIPGGHQEGIQCDCVISGNNETATHGDAAIRRPAAAEGTESSAQCV